MQSGEPLVQQARMHSLKTRLSHLVGKHIRLATRCDGRAGQQLPTPIGSHVPDGQLGGGASGGPGGGLGGGDLHAVYVMPYKFELHRLFAPA